MIRKTRSKRKKKSLLQFVSTCGAGLEDLVAEEIQAHGGTNTRTSPGAVAWEGKLEAGYRLNIPRMFAALILIALTGVIIYAVLSYLSHLLLLKWHESAIKRET